MNFNLKRIGKISNPIKKQLNELEKIARENMKKRKASTKKSKKTPRPKTKKIRKAKKANKAKKTKKRWRVNKIPFLRRRKNKKSKRNAIANTNSIIKRQRIFKGRVPPIQVNIGTKRPLFGSSTSKSGSPNKKGLNIRKIFNKIANTAKKIFPLNKFKFSRGKKRQIRKKGKRRVSKIRKINQKFLSKIGYLKKNSNFLNLNII